MNQNKPRVIKAFESLDQDLQEQIKLAYPKGFSGYLISFKNSNGDLVSALPFETEDKYYLVKMTVTEAKKLIQQDDDYDDDGFLKSEVQEDYEEKYQDFDNMISDDGETDNDDW